LDVTSPLETFHEDAKKAVEIHGSLIEVLVNNAGYDLVSAIEGKHIRFMDYFGPFPQLSHHKGLMYSAL
jgi:NAD(P)-dependent dehydrogenase (short-subunit alcohol dehydrogenase family)